jgi:hypothetical protein
MSYRIISEPLATIFARYRVQAVSTGEFQFKPSQKYLKFSDQAIWLSLSVG